MSKGVIVLESADDECLEGIRLHLLQFSVTDRAGTGLIVLTEIDRVGLHTGETLASSAVESTGIT